VGVFTYQKGTLLESGSQERGKETPEMGNGRSRKETENQGEGLPPLAEQEFGGVEHKKANREREGDRIRGVGVEDNQTRNNDTTTPLRTGWGIGVNQLFSFDDGRFAKGEWPTMGTYGTAGEGSDKKPTRGISSY